MLSCCTSKPVALANGCETLLSKCEIPIIDLAHVGTERCPQKGVVKQVATKLAEALSEKGLALLVNHGIPDCKLKAVYRAMDEFCELPEEARLKYERTAPSNHGYVKPGVERMTKEEEEEARHLFNATGSGGPMPDEEVPGFGSAVKELSRDFKQLTTMLLTALAVGLDKTPDFFLSKHSKILEPGNESTLRLLYYPALGAPEPGDTRCDAHCDYSTFTLIAQDCEGGFEVQSPRSERWVRVGHLPGAILVNSGDLLSCWTTGVLPALRHRVVPLAPRCRRHSIAFYVRPDDDVAIEPFAFDVKLPGSQEQSAPCRLQKKKKGVLTAYHHLQRRFRETYAS
ncbi:probable 2-oxoglutarate-dependent dioxygenase At3g49630 [Copidosoma floridanum]|uniref:probable 2-oxoglutarate-dependent dioxygenase At3g49630 n=1 Tax=Copidosoma floridanum TaxID=29053 RepID=UPI0006C97341|nr:probable 2-oxoglutarate-dependent dioxygenase At3g49630 [Copidosoma floridanum]